MGCIRDLCCVWLLRDLRIRLLSILRIRFLSTFGIHLLSICLLCSLTSGLLMTWKGRSASKHTQSELGLPLAPLRQLLAVRGSPGETRCKTGQVVTSKLESDPPCTSPYFPHVLDQFRTQKSRPVRCSLCGSDPSGSCPRR